MGARDVSREVLMMVCYVKCRCYYRVEAPIASYLGRVVKGELGPTARKVSHHHTYRKAALDDSVLLAFVC